MCNLAFADVAGRRSIDKFVICESSALRDSMTKFVDEIGNTASETEHIEERTYPKAIYLHLVSKLIYLCALIKTYRSHIFYVVGIWASFKVF